MAINPNEVSTSSDPTVGIDQTSDSTIATSKHSTTNVSPLLSSDLSGSDFHVLPEEVRKKVLRELDLAQALSPDALITEAERQRVLQDRTLQYYCGGKAVACVRSTSGEGVAILAVGENEIGALVSSVPPDGWKGVVVEFPEPL
jgi:hypothetical protein